MSEPVLCDAILQTLEKCSPGPMMVLWFRRYFLLTFSKQVAGLHFSASFKVRCGHTVHFGQWTMSRRNTCHMFWGVLRAIAKFTFPTTCSSHQSSWGPHHSASLSDYESRACLQTFIGLLVCMRNWCLLFLSHWNFVLLYYNVTIIQPILTAIRLKWQTI